MLDAATLLRELEPTAERLYERHLNTTREWFPHEHVPYSRGRDFDDAVGGEGLAVSH